MEDKRVKSANKKTKTEQNTWHMFNMWIEVLVSICKTQTAKEFALKGFQNSQHLVDIHLITQRCCRRGLAARSVVQIISSIFSHMAFVLIGTPMQIPQSLIKATIPPPWRLPFYLLLSFRFLTMAAGCAEQQTSEAESLPEAKFSPVASLPSYVPSHPTTLLMKMIRIG